MYLSLLVVSLVVASHVTEASRQKRCIVVQKQSGTHGDSSEGEDGSSSEARKPIPDRRLTNRRTNFDVEEIPARPAKYRTRRPAVPRLRFKVKPYRPRS